MVVLIITRSEDNESVAAVASAIGQRGGQAIRFDTDCFPTETQLTVEYARGHERLELSTEAGTLDLRDIGAIWHRRLEIGGRIPLALDPQMRRASVDEASRALKGVLETLPAFRLDPEPNIRVAEHKPLQLELARKFGLETPATLITNNPDAVREFSQRCPKGMIAKMLASFAIYDQGIEKVVFTNRVSARDLEDLHGLKLCPMVFQENIQKALEIRSTVVGDQVFSASIDSQFTSALDDWRREGHALVEHWQHYQLPPSVAHPLMRLMDRFKLNYGAADFILTPDGRHVFLELNPAGEFFWLEKRPGLPISAAIADVLLGLAFRR